MSECTIFEEFLACIGWVPELNRSGCDGHEFEIVGLLGPLDVEDCISTSRERQKHLLSLDVVDVHVVIVALVDSCNISLAWTD